MDHWIIKHMCNDFNRVRILDVPVDTMDLNAILVWINKVLDGQGKGACIFSINPEKIMLIRRNRQFLQLFNKADLLVPDGIGIVWAVRRLYGKHIYRVTGIDLMEQICKIAERDDKNIFVLGSSEDVNRTAVERLKILYPSLRIAGRQNGYFAKQRNSEIISAINASGTEVLFVGLGSPAQEQWIYDNLPHLNVKLCMGIGGALDVFSGRLPRVPEKIRRMGLEWMFRLIRQPQRIRRQLSLVSFSILILACRSMERR